MSKINANGEKGIDRAGGRYIRWERVYLGEKRIQNANEGNRGQVPRRVVTLAVDIQQYSTVTIPSV